MRPGFLRSQFSDSLHSLSRTQTITTAGLLLAIQMVLSSYGVIEVSDSLKISLAHLAVAPTAILFGPVVAGLQGALSDLLGFLLKPSGPYFPGFTLSAITSHPGFERCFGRRADKKRRFYNGRLECEFMTFGLPAPKKKK